MSDYKYYVYSSWLVARVGEGTTERLMPDGTWVDYPNRWEVLTEGRRLENEKKALEIAEKLFEQEKQREAEENAIAEHEAKGESNLITELFLTQLGEDDTKHIIIPPEFDQFEGQAVDSQSLSFCIHRTECRPIILSGAEVREVRVSPDGGRVAVAWTKNDLAGIDVGEMCKDDHWEPLIEHREDLVTDLVWSPDTLYIAYRIPRRSDIQSQIAWVDTRKPGEVLRMVSGAAFAWMPKAPVLIVANAPSKKLEWHDLASGKTRSLASYSSIHREDFRFRLAPSPDGERIIFTTINTSEDVSRVFSIEREKQKLDVVTQIPGARVHVFPFWGAEGDKLGLYMVHSQHNRTGLMVLRLLDRTEEILYKKNGMDGAFGPAWSPNGQFIAFFCQWSVNSPDGEEADVDSTYTLVMLDVEKRSIQMLCEPGIVAGDLHFTDDNRLVIDGGTVAHELDISWSYC